MTNIYNSQNQATEQQNIAQGSENINVESSNNNTIMSTENSGVIELKNVVSSETGATSVEPTTETLENEGIISSPAESGESTPLTTPEIEGEEETVEAKGERVEVSSKKVLSFDAAALYNALEEKKGCLLPDTSYTISYDTAIRTGFVKVAYVKGNRDIQKSHVKELIEQAKGCSSKTFSEEATCICAADVKKANEAETEPKKRIQLVDEKGNDIDLDSSDVLMYVVVLDGQHRMVACRLNIDINMRLRVVACPSTPDDIRKYIIDINTARKAWKTLDHLKSNAESGKTDGTLVKKTNLLSKYLNISEKYAQYIMFFNRDHIRKSMALAGTEGGLNDVNLDRVESIGKALILLTGDNRFARRIDFFDSIASFFTNETPDENFNRNVVCFIANMTTEHKTKFQELVDEKNYGALTSYYSEQFKEFCKSHEEDMDSLKEKADAEISEKWNARAEELEKEAKKSGSAAEMIIALSAKTKKSSK